MPWISEIHYQNTYAFSSGTAEFVEVSLTPAEMARDADFSVSGYKVGGSATSVVTLDTITPVFDASIGHYIYTVPVLTTNPDNPFPGVEAEAIALTDSSLANPVVSFYDIGGGTQNITAIDGPAAGATSVNIPASAPGESIQFAKFGERVDGPITPNTAVICFAGGTLIETENGPLAVENIEIGTKVRNEKGKLVEVKWIGKRHVTAQDLSENEKLLPVRIQTNALGNGLPSRDLFVSRQHRIFVTSPTVSEVLPYPETLIPAVKLVGLPGISIATDTKSVTYFHLMFEQHELIWAEGALAESFFPGPQSLKTLTAAAKAELMLIFPEIATAELPKPARPIPEPKLQKQIVALHRQRSGALQ